MYAAILLFTTTIAAGPRLDAGIIEGDPNKLIEIRAAVSPPEGFDVLSQEWLVLSEAVDWRQYENGTVFVCTAPPGTYQARWRAQYVDWDNRVGRSESRVYTITIRGPPDPKPPGPGPDPDPDPEPGDAPFPSSGFAVMIVREATDGTNWANDSEAIQYLNSKAVFWKNWDDDYTDAQLGNVPEEVKIAYRKTVELADGHSPYIAISTGNGGFHGPLPETKAGVLELLKKYGG